jgi:hypothetical protein
VFLLILSTVALGAGPYVTRGVSPVPLDPPDPPVSRRTESDEHKHAAAKPDLQVGAVRRTGFPFFPLRHGEHEWTLVAAEKCHQVRTAFLTGVI